MSQTRFNGDIEGDEDVDDDDFRLFSPRFCTASSKAWFEFGDDVVAESL